MQKREEKPPLLADEPHKERESRNKKPTNDLISSPFIDAVQKPEVAKKRPDDSEVLKLKNAMKKMEERIELLSIEKEQLERCLTEKNEEIDGVKFKLQSAAKSTVDLKEEYQLALRNLKELTEKVNSLASLLPSPEEYAETKKKLEEYEKLKKELKNGSLNQKANHKPAKKSIPKDAIRDNGSSKDSQSTLEAIKSMLQNDMYSAEKINSSFIKEITNEYFHLELEFEEYKQSKEEQMRHLSSLRSPGIEMNEKEEELQQLRKEVILLKNQKEVVIFDMNKQVAIDDTPYQQRKNLSMEGSILLGRSYPRDDETADDRQLTESHPKKRLIVSGSNNKELCSESKYTLVGDPDSLQETSYPNTRLASQLRPKLI